MATSLTMAAAAPVGATIPTDLPSCADVPATEPRDGSIVGPWQAVLDEDGVVVGHRMILRRQGAELTIRTGPRGFATDLDGGRVLVGERTVSGTQLTLVDSPLACRRWMRRLERLAYDAAVTNDGSALRIDIVSDTGRRLAGTLVIDVETGATNAMIDGECTTVCEPNDGELEPAAFLPAGQPRPVPSFSAGGWPRSIELPFKWRNAAAPPVWAKTPLKNAAADASDSSISRSPDFFHRSGAPDSVRYTAAFPTFCRYGIACASRSLPAWWAVWIRPHGTDFSWGLLRWCQKKSGTGCFDLRRVMLHELGHVTGLNHPASAGFRLAAHETVMHAITPSRPEPGSGRHAFGRCDVATLQRLYDVPNKKSLISTCNDLATTLSLTRSTGTLSPGESVKLKATLSIADWASYGHLGGNTLAARSVKLRYRRAGSNAAWTIEWMTPIPGTGRYELTVKPTATWEYQASFPSPEDEGLRHTKSNVVSVKVVG